MNANFEALRAEFKNAELNAEKFYNKGNKSAGTRLRKSLNEIKKLSLALRKEITAAKNEQA